VSILLTAYVGGIGNGKTLLMTYHAYLKHLSGYSIYSNYTLDFDHKKIVGLSALKELFDQQKSIRGNKLSFEFDEGWLEIDSRKSQKKKNIDYSQIILQSRKAWLDIDVTAQGFGQLDIRLREVVDRMFAPRVELWEGEPLESDPLLLKIHRYKRNSMWDFVEIDPIFMMVTDRILNLYNTYEIIGTIE
jgi:hypothetical protein